jgi:hypothetical protein
MGVSDLTPAHCRPHEHPARYSRKDQIVPERKRNAKSHCANFTNSCVAADFSERSKGFSAGRLRKLRRALGVKTCVTQPVSRDEALRVVGSLALPTHTAAARREPRLPAHRAKVSWREITWNGVNETVIRCSSSTVSSSARSSKILTIAAFFNGRAVSKVVCPRFP